MTKDIQLREIFHFIFFERLLKTINPNLMILKGGVNLRFFLSSPRYSEDMDIDILGSAPAPETLRKNVYKLLRDSSFRRALVSYGIESLLLNDPEKAKQTDVTQRFRVRLINRAGEQMPTKVEFSRRGSHDAYVIEPIATAVARTYRRLSYPCQHYTGGAAVVQKLRALAGRPATQARDLFDLYVLFLGDFFRDRPWKDLAPAILEKATQAAMSISYAQFRDQVVPYLDEETRATYSGETQWSALQDAVIRALS